MDKITISDPSKRKKTKRRRRRSRRRRMEILRNRIIFAIAVIAVVWGIVYIARGAYQYITRTEVVVAEVVKVNTERTFETNGDVKFDGRYQKTFDDQQDVQIVAAQRMGIRPQNTHENFEKMAAQGHLVHVKECNLYENLADHPYLVPEAKALLDEIATRYQDRHATGGRLRLTSCMRTHESVSKLARRNVNSVKHSCHLYGTTFDLSYGKMEPSDKMLLAQVLYELQQAGHCYVKYEYKQPCFHITVRPQPKK